MFDSIWNRTSLFEFCRKMRAHATSDVSNLKRAWVTVWMVETFCPLSFHLACPDAHSQFQVVSHVQTMLCEQWGSCASWVRSTKPLLALRAICLFSNVWREAERRVCCHIDQTLWRLGQSVLDNSPSVLHTRYGITLGWTPLLVRLPQVACKNNTHVVYMHTRLVVNGVLKDFLKKRDS